MSASAAVATVAGENPGASRANDGALSVLFLQLLPTAGETGAGSQVLFTRLSPVASGVGTRIVPLKAAPGPVRLPGLAG